jgi:hypothetical protein
MHFNIEWSFLQGEGRDLTIPIILAPNNHMRLCANVSQVLIHLIVRDNQRHLRDKGYYYYDFLKNKIMIKGDFKGSERENERGELRTSNNRDKYNQTMLHACLEMS